MSISPIVIFNQICCKLKLQNGGRRRKRYQIKIIYIKVYLYLLSYIMGHLEVKQVFSQQSISKRHDPPYNDNSKMMFLRNKDYYLQSQIVRFEFLSFILFFQEYNITFCETRLSIAKNVLPY